jgi:type IV secretory pathway VirJ component
VPPGTNPLLALMLSGDGGDTLPVPPEVAKLDWIDRLCLYGSEESDSPCPGLAAHGVTAVELPGDHHFGGDYSRLTATILEHLPVSINR